MTRYLLFLSYLGTRFRSVQKQAGAADPSYLDPESVQGILEISLRRFCPLNLPYVHISSRTDKGVHALKSAVHVDLERPNGYTYDPSFLIYALNRCFEKNGIDLRIQHCQIVPDTFHARHNAQLRTYLYRLAVRRPDAPKLPKKHSSYVGEIPFGEWNRCHFIQETDFDIAQMESAAALFRGVKDFRTFMASHPMNAHMPTVRLLNSLEITPGEPMLSEEICPEVQYYNFWHITCTAKSFLYRQVRRMVGALVAVAQGRITVADIQYMLDNPSADSWNPRATPVPAHGLYLMNVHYNPEDLNPAIVPPNPVVNMPPFKAATGG